MMKVVIHLSKALGQIGKIKMESYRVGTVCTILRFIMANLIKFYGI